MEMENQTKDTIIRDRLAFIRTHMANERTVLAYVRTSLAFLAAGAGMIHFVSSLPFLLGGWCLIGIGAVIFMVGITRYLLIRKRINKQLV